MKRSMHIADVKLQINLLHTTIVLQELISIYTNYYNARYEERRHNNVI